jgi:hypothetical protein
VSKAPWDSFNLGDHVNDEPQAVAENRRRLREARHLPAEPLWLEQVHGIDVIDAATAHGRPIADASVADRLGLVCAVLTADCLPVLLCDVQGTHIGAVHAGWRGLVNGVIEQTVLRMGRPANDLLAWLGPAIGPTAFEVGEEVRQAFIAYDAAAAVAFVPSPSGRWLADIYHLARLRLQRLGVNQIYGGHWCTYKDSERF